MENKQALIEVATLDVRWREAARGIIDAGWQVEQEAEVFGDWLRKQVLEGTVSLDELRGGTAWANALDAEACTLYGGDLSQGAQQLERTARRIMHHAGRTALTEINREKQFRTRSNATRNARLHAGRTRKVGGYGRIKP